jgi:glucose/arabinose dehydrogenase
MKKQLFIIAACFTFAVISCSRDKAEEPTPETGNPGSVGSVETNPANSNYRPAFTGQTRISAIRTSIAYSSRIVTSALVSPWGITSLPDGRLLVTQKAGTMRIVTTSGQVSAPITGLPAVNPGGQGGLLGLCIDPAFATNRMVYWAFSESRPEGNVTAVAKGRLADNEATIEAATVIYRATPAYAGVNHYGGRVIFDRTGHLFLSTGERSDLATRPLAQSATAALGKIIRITTNGQPAPGNPNNGQPEFYTLGHRNPQGLAIHPATGDLWQSEHGPRGGDEINRIRAGANYGWPTITYGLEYSGSRVGDGIQQREGLEQPVYYWDPVISPSGMTFYRGSRIAEWENNLFIGALSGMHIVRLVVDNNNRVTGEERLLSGENQRFRDITQGTDNALYAVTDQGRLYRIDRD